MNIDYRSIFQQIEESLLREGSERRSIEEIRSNLEPYRHVEEQHLTDDECFRRIVSIIFYSGFRAATVTNRLDQIQEYLGNYRAVARYNSATIDAILDDRRMIKHRGKVEACVYNARVFATLVNEYGSFHNYITSFAPKESAANLMRLRADLQHRLKYLGGITTFHLMTEIGLPVLKPDRVIRRIFYRLGLIESESEDEENLLATIEQGQRFSVAAQQPIRYIDIVFVAYGQVRSDEFGLDSGICLKENPRCNVCGVRQTCRYSAKQAAPRSAPAVPTAQALATLPAVWPSTDTRLGPWPRSRIVLCSGDAGPRSQSGGRALAGQFFPGGKWVGAMRNAAVRLGCRMMILTTEHGLVRADAIIEPYDLHIHTNRDRVRGIWNRTIPQLIDAASTDVVIFHAGGCPDDYADELRLILHQCGIALLVFGHPNMADIGKVDELVGAITAGATLDDLRSRLKYPTSLKYFPPAPVLAPNA